MNLSKLQESANRLKTLLSEYAPTNDSAMALERALTPVLQSALLGTLTAPVDTKEIPGRRIFEETTIRNLPGLEEAYSNFTMEASGGEPAALKLFRQRHAADNKA